MSSAGNVKFLAMSRRLENGSVDCRLYILWLIICPMAMMGPSSPQGQVGFEGKMSSVGLNFGFQCRANFGLNVTE